jgi:hypothetical protein
MAFLTTNNTKTCYWFSENLESVDLPIQNYIHDQNMLIVQEINLPDKIYGNLQPIITKILNNFSKTTKSMGVVIDGIGKTVFINSIIKQSNMTSINLHDDITEFCQTRKFSKPVIFIVNCDKKTPIDANTISDYGKFLWLFNNKTSCVFPFKVAKYTICLTLNDEIIQEYCNVNLKRPNMIEHVKTHKPMTFSILKAIVDEANRFVKYKWSEFDVLNIHNFQNSNDYDGDSDSTDSEELEERRMNEFYSYAG